MCHLNVLPVLPALSSLQSVGRVPVHRAVRLQPHICVLVNIVGVLRSRDLPNERRALRLSTNQRPSTGSQVEGTRM